MASNPLGKPPNLPRTIEVIKAEVMTENNITDKETDTNFVIRTAVMATVCARQRVETLVYAQWAENVDKTALIDFAKQFTDYARQYELASEGNL